MKISKTMLRDHLRPVTVHYFIDHDMHPSDVADYIPYAEGVRHSAEKKGDLPWLKLALEHLLLHPEEPAAELNGGTYAFNNSRMRDLIEIVWQTLWPEAQLPEATAAPDIELQEMTSDDWVKHRASISGL